MRTTLTLVAVIGSALLMSACAREQAPPAAADAAAGAPHDFNPISAQIWIDDVTIGSELGENGAMVAGKTGDDFAPGQAVNIAMQVKDAPTSTPVKIVWLGPKDAKVGEEVKYTAPDQQFINFTATDTKKWAKGDYRAEVWVGDEKVNTQNFQIVDASKAAG